MNAMFRGKTKEGEVVKGYLYEVGGKSYIIPLGADIGWTDTDFVKTFVEVIPDSLAMDTGVEDKNKVKIYGSFPIDGKMTSGGDTITSGKRVLAVTWDADELQWMAVEDCGGNVTECTPLAIWATSTRYKVIAKGSK